VQTDKGKCTERPYIARDPGSVAARERGRRPCEAVRHSGRSCVVTPLQGCWCEILCSFRESLSARQKGRDLLVPSICFQANFPLNSGAEDHADSVRLVSSSAARGRWLRYLRCPAACSVGRPRRAHQKSCVIISLSTRASDPSVKPWPMPNSTLFGSPL
jgi:hypothetical protein